jgi:RNA polymerase sigma factor (TIGR02999 family)
MQSVLMVDCYADLRRIARQILAGEGANCVIDPTDLVHNAALRLLSLRDTAIADEGHMLALSARIMRRDLIDRARAARAAKRVPQELLTAWPGEVAAPALDAGALDEALAALERYSPEHAKIVELRFTFGLTVEETARVTGIPERTVKRRWQSARAWLHDQMTREADTIG